MNPSEAIGRTAPSHDASASRPWQQHVPLALLLLSLVVLYGPTAWSLAHSLWQDDTHSHGPLVLLAVVWLFWRGIRAHAREALPQPSTMAGAVLLGLGLIVYVLGRSQGLYVLEVGSAIPVVLGGVLLTWGAPLARKLWFAFVFLLFLVPLPGSLIDTITQPMKLAVSWAAEHLMHAAGYPVARAGVVLGIGPYQLFVADACAGLNSLFMLEAFGLLYLNVVRHESALRNAVLAVLIVPISFIANVLRVVVLALVTFHYGDAAGQGFIHSFSGVVLFGVALVLTVGADAMVRALTASTPILRRSSKPNSVAERVPSPALLSQVITSKRVSTVCTGLAAISAISALTLAPSQSASVAIPDLEAGIPNTFGEWTAVSIPTVPVDVVPREAGETDYRRPFDKVVMRAYANPAGEVVAMAVVYVARQNQEMKIHRPELCYESQGFRVSGLATAEIANLTGVHGPVAGKRMYAQSAAGSEAVSYWIRVGSLYTDSAWRTRWHIFLEGIRGHVLDGAMVRLSRPLGVDQPQQTHFDLLDRFATSLLAATAADARQLLVR